MCSRSLKLAVLAITFCSCGETEADRMASPPPGRLVQGNRQSDLQPGPVSAVRELRNPFEGKPEAIEAGKQLYSQFNCAGCHAAGGGAIGPALIDDVWIYGNSPGNIFWTIIEGRPQGMPSFGGRIAEEQAWRIVSYVRSLAELPPKESR